MMNTIKDFLKKPWAWNVIAGLAGVLFGLIVLGWWLVPVQWKDATPAYLRQDIKADYLRMTVDSYAVNKDVVLAKTRWDSLGKDAEKLFSDIQIDTKNISSGDLAAFARVVNASISTGAPAAVKNLQQLLLLKTPQQHQELVERQYFQLSLRLPRKPG